MSGLHLDSQWLEERGGWRYGRQLLLSCFAPEAAALLREQSLINREAFDYSRLLEEKAHLPLVQDIV